MVLRGRGVLRGDGAEGGGGAEGGEEGGMVLRARGGVLLGGMVLRGE